MCLGTDTLWERRIANNIAKSLPVVNKNNILMIGSSEQIDILALLHPDDLPLWLMLFKHFPLGVIPDDPCIDESTDIQALRSKLRHLGEVVNQQPNMDTAVVI